MREIKRSNAGGILVTPGDEATGGVPVERNKIEPLK
jgi:hypothetical protein